VSDDFWTSEPIEAWKVVLHVSDLDRRTGYPEYVSPVWYHMPVYVHGSLAAECLEEIEGRGGNHGPAPELECGCGWYAWKHYPDAAEYAIHHSTRGKPLLAPPIVELWQVELSGVVIEHEHGYRSQYVRWVKPARRVLGVTNGSRKVAFGMGGAA